MTRTSTGTELTWLLMTVVVYVLVVLGVIVALVLLFGFGGALSF